MTTISLDLDLNTQRGMEAFFTALDDPRGRLKLASAKLPPSVSEVVSLSNDKTFEEMAVPLARRILAHQQEVRRFEHGPDKAFGQSVVQEGERIRAYLESTYPQGFELLKSYADMVRPQLALASTVGVNTDVAANAEAVANAVVWANVGVATMVVVAAAAVVVIAAVVI